ncbi:MAG TPA: WXG100 family type VII secretion target [Marmoricola sp.]|nr:WXG100 family type VII secretion target [Marmoricola sp.]
MAQVGMDVDLVRGIGNQLKNKANDIETIITQIDNLINQAIGAWQGNDANQFRDWWNQQHRPAMSRAAEAVEGLGQSAMNNADEQEGVSNR